MVSRGGVMLETGLVLCLNSGYITELQEPDKELNANRYATKKTAAQGMLDLALLTSNAAQLKFVLAAGEKYEYYEASLALIIFSLVLQGVAGILFLIVGGLDINDEKHHRTADVINNVITGIILFITIVNVVISAFDIQSSTSGLVE